MLYSKMHSKRRIDPIGEIGEMEGSDPPVFLFCDVSDWSLLVSTRAEILLLIRFVHRLRLGQSKEGYRKAG